MTNAGGRSSRRRFLHLAAASGAGMAIGLTDEAQANGAQPRKVAIVPFASAPFPFRGRDPDTNVDFLNVLANGRRGHTSSRGGIYWEDETFSDNRVLLGVPRGFNIQRRAAIVVFFHGNGAQLERDVLYRQAVLDQLEDSGFNGALLAPQFALDALDSSAGKFWLPGGFASFMREAAGRLGKLHGAKGAEKAFNAAPIIMIAYSGGYDPAAYVLANGDDHRRIRGVILLDAVFGDERAFAEWIIREHRSAFLFSAYSAASEAGNLTLQRLLQSPPIHVRQGVPQSLGPDVVGFLRTSDEVDHNDFVTNAWERWPMKALLARTTI